VQGVLPSAAMVRFALSLLLVIAVVPRTAGAHDLAATLGVVDATPSVAVCDVASNDLAPRVIRTSIGPVYQLDDGGWGFGCPALHGDGATGPVVQLDDGTLVSVSNSRVWRSTNDGCAWDEVALPGDRWFAYDLVAGEGAALVLARDTSEAGVFAVTATGGLDPRFTSVRDVEADPAALTPDGAASTASGLLVAGARPVADTRLITDAGAISLGAPDAGSELQRLSLREVDAAGAWAIATTDAGRQLARLDGFDAGGVWSLEGPVVRSVHGPVSAGGVTWAVLDGVVHRRDAGTWSPALDGDFTCIAARDDVVWLCDLYQLLALRADALDAGDDAGIPVFSFAQLDARPDRCPWDEDTTAQCANEWVHYGAENGFVGRDPAVCPDGGPPPAYVDGGLDGADAGTSGDGGGGGSGSGCAAARGASPFAAWFVLAGLALFARRRR